MAKPPPFDDSIEGWARARMFRDFVKPEKKKLVMNSLKEAIILATWHPKKYIAWKATMRMRYGDKFTNMKLFEVEER